MHNKITHSAMVCQGVIVASIFAILVSLAEGSQSVLPEKCGINEVGKDIIAIEFRGKFPWNARLKYVKNGTEQYSCEAFLIHPQFVLTSAVCVTFKHAGELSSVVLSEGTQEIDSKIVHPEYHERKNDIALIKLKNAVTFNDYLQPICLTDNESVKKARSYKISGWNKKGQENSTKFEAQEPLVDLIECQTIYRNRNVTIDDNYLCANGERSCDALSGTPLMYSSGDKYYAAGIASFGPTTCGSTHPTVYTSIIKYVDWISQTIKNNL